MEQTAVGAAWNSTACESDATLLDGLRAGEPAALEVVIDRYSAYVAGIISRQLGGFSRAEDVEELAADTFFALWQHRQRLQTDHLHGWLATTARNRARSYLRQLRTPEITEEDCFAVANEDATAWAEQQEQAECIRQALDSLGEPDREIFLRYYYRDQKVAYIAQRLSIPVSTVKSKLHRGRKKLKTVLTEGGIL